MFWTDYDLITPWRDLYRLRDEMDKAFSDNRVRTSTEYPAVNIWSSSDDIVLTAELPGIDTKNIDLSISGDTLTLKGERNPEELKEDESYHRQERSQGKFVRSIKLPFIVDNNKVEAECKNGILKIRLPKAESEKQKKITIKAS
jgi:HSP20 family protein